MERKDKDGSKMSQKRQEKKKALQGHIRACAEAAWQYRTRSTLLFPNFTATVTGNISLLGTGPTILHEDNESFLPQVMMSLFLK